MRTCAADNQSHRRALPPACLRSWTRVTFAVIEAVKTGMTNVAGHFYSHIGTVSQAVPAALSQAPSSIKRPSPSPSLPLIVGMQGKRSLWASSSIVASKASCERTRPLHSCLLSRAAIPWLLATLPNAERKTCFYCHFIDNSECKSYNGTKVVTWLPTGRT